MDARLAFRRLKDRIDALCKLAVETPDGEELSAIIQELRNAIREHTQSLRRQAVAVPYQDRRANDFSRPSPSVGQLGSAGRQRE